jgi:D-threo-aldose 1-dehydrogenase
MDVLRWPTRSWTRDVASAATHNLAVRISNCVVLWLNVVRRVHRTTAGSRLLRAWEDGYMTTKGVESLLPKRALGATGLMVDPLCIGTSELGDLVNIFPHAVGEEPALATARAILAGPIGFVDTAADYGESERRIGIALRERGGLPPGFVLSTKAGCGFPDGDVGGDHIRRSVERSLHLLGLDRLQLVYLHDPEETTFERAMAPGGAVEALQRCKDEGLIEHIGVAGGPIDLMIRYVETGAFEVVISHNRYTLLNVAAAPLWDLAGRRGLAAVNAAPYGGGILSKGPTASPKYAYRPASADLLARARCLEEPCAQYQVPLAAAALQFSMRDPRIASTVVGISRSGRLAHTIALAQHPIPNDFWSAAQAIRPDTVDLG